MAATPREATDVTIRPLRADDLDAYRRIREEALREAPLAFSSSPEDDFAGSPDAVRAEISGAPDALILGAFGPDLAGVAGVRRDRKRKSAHRVRIWGMYVRPAHRRHGVATGLLDAAVRHARSLPGTAWVHLGVATAAPDARRLYERAGFRVWGAEPDAVRDGDRATDVLHMVLRLDRPAGGGR